MGARIPRLRPLELVKLLSKLGITVQRQKGSHAQLAGFYRGQVRFTTIPIHAGEELPQGIVLAAMKDCGISKEELLRLLKE